MFYNLPSADVFYDPFQILSNNMLHLQCINKCKSVFRFNYPYSHSLLETMIQSDQRDER